MAEEIDDLYYYMVEFDITDRAAEIDTEQVAVHILQYDWSGACDWSGSFAHGIAAHEAILNSISQERHKA